jgi:hypothetical protein
MAIRTLRLATLVTLSAALIACEKTSPTETADKSIGQFALVAAENVALPATVFDGIVVADPDPSFHLRIVATSGSITIDATGHYEQRVSHDAFIDGSLGGRATHVDRGECTRSGAQLQCSSSYLQNVEFTGTLADGILTIQQDLAGEGHAATYRYQWTAATLLSS